MSSPTIVWFRDDLRVADHPALDAAVTRGEPIVALYVLDEESDGIRPLGGAARWWLHGSLSALADSIEALGGRLLLRRGRAEPIVLALADELHAGLVLWNRRYGGPERDVDAAIKEKLGAAGREVHSLPGSLLTEPWQVETGAGEPFRVYTPFANALRSRFAHHPPRSPLSVPDELPAGSAAATPSGDSLDDWALLPTRPDWAEGLREQWQPGEASAHEQLETFLGEGLRDYSAKRNLPAAGATSTMSPHLRFGELSSAQAWHSIGRRSGEGAASFRNELMWREFAWHTLFSFPELHERSWRAEYDRFPWLPLDEDNLRAWQQGRTGIPLVDAGMRQLWRTGHMHNRIRMVTASFLIKHLLIDWRLGEQWFWDTLVDADAASNPFNWQWVAGSGVDAAPYFRVFNPGLQATKFDPEGEFIRQWVPEVGTPDYPAPIVDLAMGRKRALAAYAEVR
jgi:deoxyribodipyrimidine photo-lyase